MIKKIIAKLTSWREKETNFAYRTFKEKSAEESRLAKERHQQEMESRPKKYFSEVTIPGEEQILGPSDSGLKKDEEQKEEIPA